MTADTTFAIEHRSYDHEAFTQTVSDASGNSATFRHGASPRFAAGSQVLEVSARPRDRGFAIVIGRLKITKVRAYKRNTKITTSDGREWSAQGFAWQHRDAPQRSRTVIKELIR